MSKLPAFCFNCVRTAWLFFAVIMPWALSNCTTCDVGAASVALALGRLEQPANINAAIVAVITKFLCSNQLERSRKLFGACFVFMLNKPAFNVCIYFSMNRPAAGLWKSAI
ncbi:MAG: hypothetical protein ABIT70_05480, partial [Sulfuriferula sp.]